MTWYVENLQESTKKLLQLINMSIKVAEYKVSIKIQWCLYITAMNSMEWNCENHNIYKNFEKE